MPSSKSGSEFWIDGSHREAALEDFYIVGPELGRGATSVVFSCQEKGTGAPYAAKILKKTIDKKIVRTEIGVLLRLSHPNICKRILENARVKEMTQKSHLGAAVGQALLLVGL